MPTLSTIRAIGLLLVVATALSACGRLSDSNISAFGWFNRETRSTLMPEDAEVQTDRRQLVQVVNQINVEPTLDGVQLHAEGLAAGLGYYDASLVADNDGYPVDGVLSFQFQAAPPFGREAGLVTNRARTVRTAVFLSNFDLRGVREIRVFAATNSRAIRP